MKNVRGEKNMYGFLDEDMTYESLNEYQKRKADWLEEMTYRYSDTTRRTYWIVLNTRINFLEVDKQKDLYDWNKEEIVQTIKTTATTSESSKRVLFSTIYTYITWACEKGFNDKGNPCEDIDKTGLFDMSSEAKKQMYKTLQEFYEFIFGLNCSDVDRALLTLLRYGVPIDNVGTVRWEDVDRENKILNIYREDEELLKLPIDNLFIMIIDNAKKCNEYSPGQKKVVYVDYGYIIKATPTVKWKHISAEDVYNKIGNLSKANRINRISVPNLNISRKFDLLFEIYKKNGVVTNIDIEEVIMRVDGKSSVSKNTRVKRDFQLISGYEVEK